MATYLHFFLAYEMKRPGRAEPGGRKLKKDRGNTNMAGYNRSEYTQEAPAEARIWQAVLLQAVEEWQSAPLRIRRKAEEFLFITPIFPLVCSA